MKKKRKTNVRVLSVLLTLCLMLSVVFSAPMTVTATETETGVKVLNVTVPNNAVESNNGLEEVKRTPIRRLYEEEGDDLNKTVWLNDDGTRTMTIYDYPVKFVNAAGQIQDISLDVAEANDGSGAFKTAAGWANTVFPSRITDGVTLSGNGEALKLTPVMPQGSLVASAERSNKLVAKDKVSRKDNKTVSYNYDSKTNIEYSLTYNGFKEDIVVNEYTGQTEYSFLLETNGLTLVNNNGSYHLEDAKGNIKASVGDVIIFTADERNNTMGYMTHTTVKENHSYFLTIHVDADWLKDEKTVYPIRIDPTLEMTDTEKLVEDVTIYSGGAVNPTSTILCVGNRSDLGVCRTLMKFPNLDLSDISKSVNVVSAGIKLYDLYKQEEPMGVYCYIYDGNDWEDNTATWGNNANGYTHFMSHNDVSRDNTAVQVARDWYYFSITDAVKYWLLTDEQKAARPDNFDIDKGIMLKAKNDTTMDYQYKAFGSYNNATYRPQIEIVYNSSANISKPFGWLDKVNANEISGWAWCLDYPNTSLVCAALLYNETTGMQYIFTGTANREREDVAAAGYGTGFYGFKISINWDELELGKYRIEVEAWDVNNFAGYILPQGPKYYHNNGFRISEHLLESRAGFTHQLVATAYDSKVKKGTIVWTSSDPSVASVDSTGYVTVYKTGIVNIRATYDDGKSSTTDRFGECEIWVEGKTPVILIHGRTSNALSAWGAANDVYGSGVSNNNHYTPLTDSYSQGSVPQLYTSVRAQQILAITNGSDVNAPNVVHAEGGNLAYYLQSNGYVINETMFVFNYPNQDTVIHSAKKLNAYLNNLAQYVRESGSSAMKACFFGSKSNYDSNNYTINIVGHSMGGLVARYYIENLGKDEHVDKLITIGTPHWGSGLADASNITSLGHLVCDHDLDLDSAMYGGNGPLTFIYGCSLWDGTELWNKCVDATYILTDELQYSEPRRTKYYAIVGVDYVLSNTDQNDYCFEITEDISTYQDLSDYFALKGVYTTETIKVDVDKVGDNIVGLLSQMGWTDNSGDSPNKTVPMYKIFIDVDTNGGNSLLFDEYLHSKIPHRTEVMAKVHQYLSE